MPDNKLSGEFILSSEKEKIQVSDSDINSPTVSANTGSEKLTVKENHTYSKPHFYSAFSHYPKGFTFKDQEEDEEVILLVRQHLITNLPWILGFTLLGFIPPLFFFFSPFFLSSFPVSGSMIAIIVSFYYLALFTFAILYFALWYFNVGIITSKRIIDIDVPNILIRVLSEARLNAVQDVTITQVGGIRSIFNYGDVDIQTEAVRQNLEFYRVPQPNFIRTVVGNLVVHRR